MGSAALRQVTALSQKEHRHKKQNTKTQLYMRKRGCLDFLSPFSPRTPPGAGGREGPTAAGHKPTGVLGDTVQSCLLRENCIRLEAVNGDMKSPTPQPPLPLLLIYRAG